MRRTVSKFRLVLVSVAAWFMILGGASAGLAQTTGSEIDVTVTDPSGAYVPSAKVQFIGTLTHDAARTTKTDSHGFAAAALLQPDTYDVIVDAPGFNQLIEPAVLLNVGSVVRLDLKLKVGDLSVSVTVAGEGVADLNLTTASLGQVIDHETMEALPLNGRDYLDLGLLTPGTAPSTTREGSYATYGLRGSENVFMLDGILNESYMRGLDVQQRDAMRPSIEAIQEFNVQTSNYSAQYGSAAGAVISAVTKGGTNNIHGSVFEFFRNEALDAKDYFIKPGDDKPKLRLNMFGGSLGGPIVKNKAWIFGAYQGTDSKTDNVFTGNVPTAVVKGGVFATNVFNPYTTVTNPTTHVSTRTMFANRTITSDLWDPIGAALVQSYPDPNVTGQSYNYENTAPDRSFFSNATFRHDLQLSDRSSLFARLSFNLGNEHTFPPLPAPLQPNVNTQTKEWGIGIGFTHTFSATMVNEARFGWNRIYLDKDTTVARDEIVTNSLAPGVDGTPVFTPSGFYAIGGLAAAGGGALPTQRVSGIFDISDNVSKILGRHSIKFGFDTGYARISDLADNTGLARGSFTFTGTYTNNPTNLAGGSGIADMLLGLAQTVNTGTSLQSNERGHTLAFYFQDDWKATSRLTVNFGIRSDWYIPFTEASNNQGNFIIDRSDPKFGQMVYAGINGNSRSLETVAKTNISPRVGFAYAPNSGFVIRAGFGVFFSNPDSNIGIINRMVSNPPFTGVGGVSLAGDQINPSSTFSLSNSTLPTRPVPPSAKNFVLDPTQTYSGLIAWPEQYTSPYAQEWNLSMQKRLPWQVVWETSYVGNHALHLWGNYQGNQPLTPGPGVVNTRRPLAAYTIASIAEVMPFAASKYQGFSTRAQKTMKSGVFFLASYTYGKSMDQMSSSGTGYTNNVSTVQNSYDLASMWSNSDFDRKSRLVFSGIWQLPWGPQRKMLQHGIVGKMVGNWDVTGIWTWQTGSPLTLTMNTDVANVGNITWPDRVPGCRIPLAHPTINEWFNTSCFVAPGVTNGNLQQHQYGNAGRNPVFGPGQDNLTLGVNRIFGIPYAKKARLQFRGEFYNALNHPSFGQPYGVLGVNGVNAFGTIGSTNVQNRIIQLAAKITW